MEEAQAKTNDIRDTIKAEILVREVEGLTAGTYIERQHFPENACFGRWLFVI